MTEGISIRQAKELLGDDYVISRAITWQTSKNLCRIAGQRDPSEYWACATWDEQHQKWIEPTLVFRKLRDLVMYYRAKTGMDIPIHELFGFSLSTR